MHSAAYRHSGAFHYILVYSCAFHYIPLCLHSVAYRHSGAFRCIPLHSCTFALLPYSLASPNSDVVKVVVHSYIQYSVFGRSSSRFDRSSSSSSSSVRIVGQGGLEGEVGLCGAIRGKEGWRERWGFIWGWRMFFLEAGEISFIYFSHIFPGIWGYFSKFLRK